ncbi:MAG: biopolymer transporter ExbD [Planctomycetia bacterium]|nr:biopolymer transporter ExbD [Planctomycetia bacterium]
MARKKGGTEEVKGDMTPMIDMVFQLLIFFILTLKIVDAEGDFNMKMPLQAGVNQQADIEPPETITLFLNAQSNGDLASITIGSKTGTKVPLGELSNLIRGRVGGTGGGSDPTVELAPDGHLKYAYVVQVLGACSGRMKDGKIEKLASKIKFAGL